MYEFLAIYIKIENVNLCKTSSYACSGVIVEMKPFARYPCFALL